MATFTRFEDLDAWKVGREVTREVYRLTKKDKFSRDFGLRDQICRAAVSIMANIAEGFERDGNREFVNFLSIAKGSAGEVRSHLYVALDQDYISGEEFRALEENIGKNCRIIAGLMNYIKSCELRGLKFRK